MKSVRRTSEGAQDHVELGLELGDPSELDPQLPFRIGKPLVYAANFVNGRGS